MADEDNEEEIQEREDLDDSPEKQVNTNVDSLDDYSKQGESWSKRDADQTNSSAHSDKGLWSQTLKFGRIDFDIPEGEEPDYSDNKYLELNREQKIIEIEKPEETALDQNFVENSYWAPPKDSSINVDDLLKEFESF